MSASSLTDLVARLRRDLEAAPAKPLRVSGLRGSAPALVPAPRPAPSNRRPVLVVAPDAPDGGGVRRRPALLSPATATRAGPLGRRVHYLPGWEVPPFEPLSPTREIVAARAEGLYHLLQTPDPVDRHHGRGAGPALPAARRLRRRRHLRRRGRDHGAGRRSPSGWSSGATTACRWSRTRATWRSAAASSTSSRPATRVRSASSSWATTSSGCASSTRCRSARSTAWRRSLLLPDAGARRARASAPAPARLVDERAAELGLARQERRELVEAVRSGLVVPGHRVRAALPLRRARHAGRLPAAGHALLDARRRRRSRPPSRPRGRRSTSHAEAAQRDGRFFPPPERLYLDPAAWRARSPAARASRSRALEELAGDGPRATHVLDRRARAARRRRAAEGPLAQVAAQLAAWQREGTRLVVRGVRAATQRERLQRLLARARHRDRAERRAVPAGARRAGPRRARARRRADPRRAACRPTGSWSSPRPRSSASGAPVRRGRRAQPARSPLDARRAQDRRLRRARRPRHRRSTAACAHMQVAGHRGRLPAPRVPRRRPPLRPGRPHQRRAALRERRRRGAGARQARRHVVGAGQGEDARSRSSPWRTTW